jgi:hypothetical protein
MTPSKADRDMVLRAIESHSTDCPKEATLVETVKDVGFIGEEFHVGDEVTSTCGSVVGVVLSITGEDALISWSCRGKSVEHLVDLTHVPHMQA